jgi:hypothetical protein
MFAALAILSVSLLSLTLISHRWIELIVGVDLDGGSGALEWGITFALLAASVAFIALGRTEWKRQVAVEASSIG